MDIAVYAGSTKANGAQIASLTFQSPQGERVCLLLQSDASASASSSLEEECARIVRHSLLSTEGEPWHRLDGTLKELNGLFKGLFLSGAVEEVNAVVALCDASDTLHVSHAGRGEAYLVRGGLTSQVTEFSRGKPVSAFVHISTGALEEGDIVVLSTQRLLRTFTPAQVAALAGKESAVEEIASALEAEREAAALAIFRSPHPNEAIPAARPRAASVTARRARRRGTSSFAIPGMDKVMDVSRPLLEKAAGLLKRIPIQKAVPSMKSLKSFSGSMSGTASSIRERAEGFIADLRHPERKKRAHLLLVAGVVALFLIIWLLVSLSMNSARGKTKAELSQLITQIESDLRTADNRKLAGDTDAANTLLQRAGEKAKQVMDNESGLYRVQALDLLDRIRQKQEEMNNIVRTSPRLLVNLTSANPSVAAQGLVGIGDGEFVVYDRQYAYRVLLSKLDEPRRLTEGELILQGTPFARFNTQAFLTTGNSLLELNGSQVTTMKTDDPNGWKTGKDIETYLRYLYLLSPEEKQIYKYERLNNRYGPPVAYNVNADLTGAIDMTIDGSVYVLKEGGTILKLLRGEAQPFVIRHAPADIFKTATKLFKVPSGRLYVLDPESNRVIVINDGGAAGETAYVRQYILEHDQMGTLQDLFVDPEQTHLYVTDEKRVYVVDLSESN